MLVALFGRPQKGPTLETALQLIPLLQREGIRWVISDKLGELILRTGVPLPKGEIFMPEDGLPPGCAFCLSIGGDGTLLEAVSFCAQVNVPVVGIHTGRMGFLSSISFTGLEDIIRRLITGQFVIEERTLIHLDGLEEEFEGRTFALNECAIMKRDSSAMITVHAFLEGQYLNSYWADGLIVSTPTGSTGYSLSCGGPIMHPSSESFVITPVSPHNLNVRPLVVPDTSSMTFEVEGRSRKILVSLDTRSRGVELGTSFGLRREKFRARLVRLPQDEFINTLRSKLYWGADLRN